MSAGSGSPSTRARVDELIAEAKQRTGLEDFGGDSWREGLEIIVGSALTEASFTPDGEVRFFEQLIAPLVDRLQIEDWYTRHPEIDDQEVFVELLGVGFPRTGSTALSHMLGEDDRARSLRMWETQPLCPPAGVSAEADRARLEAAEQVVGARDYFQSRLRSMLPQSATGPTEDHNLMGLEFKAQYFLVSAHIPTYADWFIDCEMESTYRYERRALKLLQWKTPQDRWWLKSPTHTLFLEDYAKVFPETRFVQTHRDVSRVLPSVADLYYTMLQGGNNDVDPVEVGTLNMDQWGVALDRSLAFRDNGHEDLFYDIGFTAFQADPISAIRGLYEWLGHELTPEIEARMLAWREGNPRDKYGRHTYDAEMFGITPEALDARFGAYRERFGSLLD